MRKGCDEEGEKKCKRMEKIPVVYRRASQPPEQRPTEMSIPRAKNINNDNDKDPKLNFLKGTVHGDKEQGKG